LPNFFVNKQEPEQEGPPAGYAAPYHSAQMEWWKLVEEVAEEVV